MTNYSCTKIPTPEDAIKEFELVRKKTLDDLKKSACNVCIDLVCKGFIVEEIPDNSRRVDVLFFHNGNKYVLCHDLYLISKCKNIVDTTTKMMCDKLNNLIKQRRQNEKC